MLAYDTIYAMVDRADDLRIGVKSTAILFGRYDRALIAIFQLLTLAVLFLIGNRANLNAYYYGGLIIAGGFAIYQQMLIRNRDETSCFKAFLNNAWFGAAVFIGLVLSYL